MGKEKDKFDFYQEIKENLTMPSMDKIAYLLEKSVKTQNKDLISYKNITSIGVEPTEYRADRKQYADFLKKVYYSWYVDTLFKQEKTTESVYFNNKVHNFLKDSEYFPSNKNLPIFKVLREMEGRCHEFGVGSPTYFQGDFCHIYLNHFEVPLKTSLWYVDTRMYLNIKKQNRIALANEFFDYACKKKLPLIMKFAVNKDRNDNFVLYAEYQKTPEFLKMIDDVKRKNPKLFEDCKVKNPLFAKYKNYVGIGDEPMQWGSYLSTRCDMLNDCYKQLSKEHRKNLSKLTKEVVVKKIEEVCKKYRIDSKNFCTNKDEDCEMNFGE